MTSTVSPAPSSGPSPQALAPSATPELLAWAAGRPEGYALVAHGLRPAQHHLEWLTALRETVDTPGARVLLIAPPGSAKSTYTSFVLPLWFLGRHPSRSILAVTSSDDMAHQFHGVVELALRASPGHRAVFPDPGGLPDVARGWSSDGLFLRAVPATSKDPSYRCAGFGASVIGSRCHLLLLDDPVSQEASTSAVEMRRVRQHLDMTLLQRLHPEGSAVAIMTRWAEEDTAAHLLSQGWRLVHTPALGDYPWLTESERDPETRLGSLWAARWSRDWLLRERRRLGGAQWETVWMGNPIAVGAGVFKDASWFRPLPDGWPELAASGRLVRCTGIDVAWSSKQAADETVATTIAFDPSDPQRRLYVLAVWRRRVDAADDQGPLAQALAEHLGAVRPHAVGVEADPFRQLATGQLVLRLREALVGRLPVGAAVYPVPVATDKVTRARPFAAHAEAGLVFVDRRADWWLGAEHQLLAFPTAAHDDVVDAGSLAVAMALGQIGQQAAERPTRLRFGGGRAA